MGHPEFRLLCGLLGCVCSGLSRSVILCWLLGSRLRESYSSCFGAAGVIFFLASHIYRRLGSLFGVNSTSGLYVSSSGFFLLGWSLYVECLRNSV